MAQKKSPQTIMHKNGHFTLIELIVVIVIIMIIVGMTVPAFNRIVQGNAVNHAASMVASELNLARVEACNSGKYVAVVFADSSVAQELEKILSENEIYNKRAMRCCYVDKTDAGINFLEWVPNTVWNLIPQGAHFDFYTTEANKKSVLSTNPVVKKSDAGEETEFNDGAATSFTFSHVIVFNPLGRPDGDATVSVVVKEGIYTANDEADTEPKERLNADNRLIIKANRYTGNVNVSEINEE